METTMKTTTIALDTRIGADSHRDILARVNDTFTTGRGEIIERINDAIEAWCQRDPEGRDDADARRLDAEIDEIIGDAD